jgi:hypothetical protein
VITSINGEPVARASDFAMMISAMAPSTIVYLRTYRDGRTIEVKLMLGSEKCPEEQHGGRPCPGTILLNRNADGWASWSTPLCK